jgi:predicted heme/steroid binding protein
MTRQTLEYSPVYITVDGTVYHRHRTRVPGDGSVEG